MCASVRHHDPSLAPWAHVTHVLASRWCACVPTRGCWYFLCSEYRCSILPRSIQGICNTPHSKLLIWPSSARGMSLHTHSTSLTLSSSLYVKGLTYRYNDWNDKAYKLAFTLLNFQGGTKPANHNHTFVTWANFTTSTCY
jgi:hypothetical protein